MTRDEYIEMAGKADAMQRVNMRMRIIQLEKALRDLATVPAVLHVLGREHTPECGCPLCRAHALLNNPLSI